MKNPVDPHLFALTGSIGSGKSAAADFFKEIGFHIIDADEISKDVSQQPKVLEAVRSHFGQEYLSSDGNSFDRKKIGERIFTHPADKQFLEALLHPLIRSAFFEQLAVFRKTHPTTPVLHVVPLFFESKLPKESYRAVCVVAAHENIRRARVMERDACSEETAIKRDASQMPQSEKILLADYVIWNNGTLSELKAAVEKCVHDYFLRITT